MSDKQIEVPEKKKSTLFKRILGYIGTAAVITVFLFFLTPGMYADEAISDVFIIVIATLLEIRNKKNKK